MKIQSLFFGGLVLFIMITNTPLFSQNVDSLQNVVKTGSLESKFEALRGLVNIYMYKDISKALNCAWEEKYLAKEHKQSKWLADAYENLGTIYYYEQQIDSADYYYRLTLDEFTRLNDSKSIARTLQNFSNVMHSKLQLDSALILLQKALVFFEEEKDEASISQILTNMASIYYDMDNYKKHDEYALKALTYMEKTGNSNALGINLINLCMSMFDQKRMDEAIAYGNRAIQAFRETDEPFFLCASLIRVSNVYLNKGDNKNAILYLNEAFLLTDIIGSKPMKTETLRLRAIYYLSIKEYIKAKNDAEEALLLTDTMNVVKTDLADLYDLLTTTSIYTNEQEDAINYLRLYMNTKNIIHQEKWIEQLSEMEVKYDTEKKELKIDALEQEKQLVKRLGIAIGIILLLGVVVIILLWFRTLQKKKLAEICIKKMEQEKQLVATQAVLDGETRERARLARDLHDGLGSMLTGIRLNLQEMKDGVKLEYSDLERFDKALLLLDESVSEMRRVSHHLMPDSLSRFGLKSAVRDYCQSLSKNITFDYFGEELRLDPQLEVMIYRTIHELVNNALKHSGADTIMVQIMQEPDRIAFIVEDNGCGFDPNAITEGSGLQNIRIRVAAYNGNFLVDSVIGKGTEMSVEIGMI